MLNLGSKVLNRSEILSLYTKGYTKPEDYKIGFEYERLPISTTSYKAVDYWTINEIFEEIAREYTWDYICEGENLIGLAKEHDTITLEPGAQLEISTKPEKTIFKLKEKIDLINSMINDVIYDRNIILLNYGVSPYSTCRNIHLIPKMRYGIMANYLWGILADVMMRETAGIQCCIDFKSEEDAMRKFKLANKLSPFMTAMFANSPIRGGVETGYKSFRALSWINTDNDRCGFAGKISENFSFDEYIDCIMKTPMIFVQRNGMPIEINGNITFEEYMNEGYEGLQPTLEDYQLQANLCFPEVRMRNFIEIRNHDCVGGDLKYAILAIYKGIFYDNHSMKLCETLLSDLQYKDLAELRYNVPKLGLQAQIKKNLVSDYAKEILKIAQDALRSSQTGEELFLNSIEEFIKNDTSPADVIVKKWNGSWNKDLRKMINYLAKFED